MTLRVALDWRLRAEAIAGSEDVAFAAPQDALPALAEAIGVDSVMSCDAKFRLVPDDNAVDVDGVVRATVMQTCVVSLEPFEATIDEPIAVRFAPSNEIPDLASMVDADGEEGSVGMADRPEPIVDGVLDFGALAQEYLALGVDPYPRKPGVVFEQPDGADGKISPFAALERLRKPEKG